MTSRIAGPPSTKRAITPDTVPVGHLSTKSSVYSPVSMSRMSQDLVYNHMKSHYQRISSAKACVDTSAPKSMKLTIKEKDKKRKEALLALSMQKHSARGRRKDNERACVTESLRCESLVENGWGNGDSHQPHLKVNTDNFHGNDSFIHNIQIDENYQRTRHTTGFNQKPQTNNSTRQNNETREMLDPNPTTTSLNQEVDNDYRGKGRLYSTSTPRFDTQNDFESDLNLSLSTTTFSYKSPPSQRRQRIKKSTGEIIWTEEQKYLQFISDVTSDVLARGICSNRVINKVFESHIEKRKDDLDEENMREMINQLKEDLGVTDD